MRLIITHNGKKLKKEKAFGLLRLVKREHCHDLGRVRPRDCTGKCSADNGKYVGHGVCLLQKIVKPEYGCGKCRSPEIVKQLNYVFEYCTPFRGKGLLADWC